MKKLTKSFPVTICRVSVEAIALGTASVILLSFLLLTQDANASTNSSWSSQPSWMNTNDSSTPPSSDSGRARTSTNNSDARYRAPKAAPFAPGSNNIALEMGQVFLMGNLGSHYSDAIGTRLSYTYGVSDLFAFNSSVGYSNHSDGHFSMASVMAGLRTNLAWYDKVVPYFSFGLGFFKPSYTGGNSSTANASDVNPLPAGTSLSPLLFGVHAGPGVDLELTKDLFFGASITFHDVFGNTVVASNGQPFDVGGTFTSFFLHAGVTF